MTVAMTAGPFDTIDFDKHKRVVVALSGGGDSTALLVMLHEWRAQNGKPSGILAVTVDHGLRPESRAEAEAAGAICERLGIEQRIVTWTGPKPKTRIQETARNARHDLLAAAAQDFGSSLVLTGHTLDDQRETVFMRRQRGEGIGLAGIAPATLFTRYDYREPQIWFVRPLSTAKRATLREKLASAGIGWIDDPSNENTDFERVSARRQIGTLSDGDIAQLDKTASEAAAERVSLGARAATIIDMLCREVSPGLFRFDPAFPTHPDRPAALYAFRIVAAFAGGVGALPDMAKAAAVFEEMTPDFRGRRTLSYCVIDNRKEGLFVLRENRRPTKTNDWLGGRYWIPQALANLSDSGVMAAGEDNSAKFEFPEPAGVPATLVKSAFLKQPVLREGEERVLIWRNGESRGWRRILNPWPHYLPSFDIAPARAVARLGGVQDVPDLPFR